MEEPLEALMLALLLLAAVLVSSVIDQLVPKISSPLIQILLGLGIALLASSQIKIELDDKLFLVLFIAPLLYDEAKNIDKASLWRNRKPVLSLAIGLVLATALVVGFAVHWLVPSISLFAAFALGAALGPTDAVAVASLSKETSISSRSKSILEGESLINDASGIVAFQFAIAAAVTGTFSLVDATADFLFSFFGGILMGIALGYLGNFLVRKVRSWGLENTTFHVLFEVFTPFIVYLVANALHTSGILAVVAAGLVNVISPRIIGPSISRMNIVSTSVWRVLSFALNGVVFVLLGTQLPLAFQGTWESTAVSNDKLIAYVLGLAFIVIFARFVWVMAMEWVHSRAERADRPFGLENVRTAAVMTLGGPKGAITLAVAFTISYAVPQRDLMIFMACGVIVVTLLLATFVVPLLAPKKPPTDEDLRCDETEVSIEILRTVIEDLAARQTAENRAATQMVIRSYNDRIARIKSRNDIEDEPNTALRLRAIARSGWHRIVAGLPGINVTERVQAIRDLQMQCAEHVVERLQQKLASPESDEPAEDVSTLLLEYQRSITALRNANPSITALTNTASKAQDIERYGLRLELEQIQARYEDGDLCRSSYKRLRENVALMQVDLEDNV